MSSNWELNLHLSADDMHSALYTGTLKGQVIQKEVHTPRDELTGEFGEPDVCYWVKDIPGTFENLEELSKALEKDNCR